MSDPASLTSCHALCYTVLPSLPLLPLPSQLRSSDIYADLNSGAGSGDFTELDFEFLSYNGLACSVWLNTFKQ